MQTDLFSSSAPEQIHLEQGEIWWFPHFLSSAQAAVYLARLYRETQWQQSEITIAGKSIPIPRLNAWYGEEGTDYAYSGVTFSPLTFTPCLNVLLARVKQALDNLPRFQNAAFNSALLNYYRDGNDSVAWHADDEPELGRQPLIASVSLGATRRFVLKRKDKQSQKPVDINLTHGSLLIMAGETQHHWLHSIPKTRRPTSARLNITFRHVCEPSIKR